MLIWLGCYFVLESQFIMCFSVSWRHGGRLPIAPLGIEPAEDVYHCIERHINNSILKGIHSSHLPQTMQIGHPMVLLATKGN